MALLDLAVYGGQAYEVFTEITKQQSNLFNEATAGAIQLVAGASPGDYAASAHYGKLPGGSVKRRNAYGVGTITKKNMFMRENVSVKIGAGTYEISMDKGQMAWIQQNPEVAGAALGQQMAKDNVLDMLNVGLGATYAALSGTPAVIYDATATAEKTASFKNLNRGTAKFGDQADSIVAWVVHSSVMSGLYDNALTNAAHLFNYGSINVVRDPFGRLIVVTDSPSLVLVGATTKYHALGLTEGALVLVDNNDYHANEQSVNGSENILTSFQAEWSFNASVKGYAWDRTSGGKSPTDAALLTSTNWDKYADSHKDLAGVIVELE